MPFTTCHPPSAQNRPQQATTTSDDASLSGGSSGVRLDPIAPDAPTARSYVIYEDPVRRIGSAQKGLKQVMDKDLSAFNILAREQNVPIVLIKPAAEASKN